MRDVVMSARRNKSVEPEEKDGNYLVKEVKPREFIKSGCTLLDCVIGGGWPLGRIANIVGDESTGKTLLAIEAFANFIKQYPNGKAYYLESEAAFDVDYAEALGMPVDKVEFIEDARTVEDMYKSITAAMQVAQEEDVPIIFCVDSLDALSDKAEMERAFDEASTFGTGKAKKMSELFRRLSSEIRDAQCSLLIISQLRENIGVMFGAKKKRSGGHALDFYASQVVWLSQTEDIKRASKGITRQIGIWVKAKCKKNKISLPYRDCTFPIIFNFGIDDVFASLEWLSTVKNGLEALSIDPKNIKTYINDIYTNNNVEEMKRIQEHVTKTWYEIEAEFIPKGRKYI
jgi:recombination protein RecA